MIKLSVFVVLLTILFVTLKLTDYISWSWWWVLSPALVVAIIIVIVMLIGAFVVDW